MGSICRSLLASLAVMGLLGCRTSRQPASELLVLKRLASPPSTSTSTAARPSPTGVLHYADALAAALQAHPDLRLHDYDEAALRAAVFQAGAAPNPTASAELENIGGTGSAQGLSGAEITLAMSQAITTAGKIDKRVRVAQHEEAMVDWDRRETEWRLQGELRRAFVAVYVAQGRAAQARENEALVQRFVGVVEERLQAGDVSQAELTTARVELSTVRLDVRRAERDLASARATLASLWGADHASFDSVAYATAPLRTPDRAQVMARLAEHPRLRRWGDERALREARVTLAEADAWPDVEVGAGLRQSYDAEEQSMLFAVSVPLPIFDRNEGTIAAARIDVDRIAVAREAIERELRADIDATLATIAMQGSLVEEIRTSLLPQAEAALASATEAYQAGSEGMMVILNAERTLLDARQALTDSEGELLLAQAELEAALATTLADLISTAVEETTDHE